MFLESWDTYDFILFVNAGRYNEKKEEDILISVH